MAGSIQGLGNLSLSDQIVFRAFGWGPERPTRYSHIHRAFESFVETQPHANAAEHDGRKAAAQALTYTGS